MAGMVTAREVVFEGVKLLTVSYLVRGGGLHRFLVFSNRIVLFFVHRLSAGPWAWFLSCRGGSHAASRSSARITSNCFMFSQTDAAERVGVEFRPSVLPALRAGDFWFCPRAVNAELICHLFSEASCP
jgi:hypothetical protein